MNGRQRLNPKRVIAITAILLLCVWAAYQQFGVHLPPQSPRKIASRISGLAIREARVTSFENQASRTHQDHLTTVELEIPADQFSSLAKAALDRDYVWLTTNDPNYVTVQHAASGEVRVLYKLRGAVETGSFDLIVLIPGRHQMIVRRVQR